jgi:WD40 repeat protein
MMPPMPDELDFTALAGMLEETIASTPGGAALSDRAGTSLHYFGDYELEEEIARGGMGVVYRARQVTLGRTVAVKVLRDTAFAGGEEVERFKVEAGAAAALRHPHIVGIHEIGEHGGTHFFSMDYVPGGTLSQLLRDGPLPARRAAALLVKIAQAIQHAHSQGVLHRDLKPANVLLDTAGEPVVTDFGLAKHEASGEGLTVSGQVLGTPAYMAPEQAEGRTRDSDARTDVYGLGALLYHMTSGRAPFTGDSHIAVMNQVAREEPVGVRLLNPSIPRDLETICAKAMSKEPPRRYQTAEAMAEDVQRFLDGKPVHARPVGALTKAWRWARRHRALAAALAAVVVLTLGVLVTITVSRFRIEGLRREAVQRLYASDMRLALQNIGADKHGAAAALLDRYAAPGAGEDLRGFEWHLARELNRSNEAASLDSMNGQVWAVAWSPDGRWIAAGAQSFRLWEWLEGRAVLRHTSEAPAIALAFSPDSKRLALSRGDGEVTICDPAAPESVIFHAPFPSVPPALAWRADGTTLEILASHVHWRWMPGQGEPRRAGEMGGAGRFQFLNGSARRGAYVVPGPSGGDAWQIVVRDTEKATLLTTVRTPNSHTARCVVCSDDDRWLLIGDYTGQISLREAPFTDRTWEVRAHRSMVDKVAISRDAALVASAGDHVIHVRDRTTGALRRILRGHPAKICSLTFSPDGTSLLSGDVQGSVKRWTVAPDPDPSGLANARVITSGDGAALCWNVTPQQVKFLPWGGEPRSLDLDTRGKEMRLFHGGIVLQATGAAGKSHPLSIHEPDKPPVELTLPGKLAACSPDGNWFVYTDTVTNLLMLTDRSGGRPPVRLGRGRLLPIPAFSANSRRCAVGENGGARVYDTDTGAEVFAVTAHRGMVHGKALSADGSLLATAGFDGVAKLWDVTSGQLRREFTGTADMLWSVAISPDGRRLAAGTGESTVVLWDTATGLETGTIALGGEARPVEFLAFTPDGAALVARGLVLQAPRVP